MYLNGIPRYRLVDDDIVEDEDDGAPGALPGILPYDDEVAYRGGLKALREGEASSFSPQAGSFACGNLNLSPEGKFALVSHELLGEKTDPKVSRKSHFENCGRRVFEDTELSLSEHAWEDLGVTKTSLQSGPMSLRWVIE
ncbi:MAG: hypothetical protein M1815_005290 [Lichina confinis]|nr:MAG: hypothetical protein M1815_005290 [Lichina confinis]